ncbi:hypothetical protein NQ318_002623 [Aromia moschata]|uniref:Uncharacterized protein n=1 Tax=Aromia moschata TaxID=1265417 RepID=A0AAV8YAX9_9CUCU|nr:hypothetical protein NQ318_002623 [Aromia moschata]
MTGGTMANLYPAEGNPQLPGNTIWFQQDGAPAHYEKMMFLLDDNIAVLYSKDIQDRPVLT